MVGNWWQAFQARRDAAAVQRRAVPDDLWKRTLVRYPFLQRRDPADGAELRRLTSLFLDRKEFTCTGGLKLTDAMAVSIAAQAALPVLRLGLDVYDGFVGITVHPDVVVTRRSQEDDDGVVHEFEAELLGEMMPGGPVMLSWPHVRRAGHSAAASLNVVIHEFVHVLERAAGGLPPLPPGLTPQEFDTTLSQEFVHFVQRVQADETTVLDPYGASAQDEFFAVASEAFFVNAAQMQKEHPVLYGMLCRLFLQDPAADQPPPRRA